MTSAPSAPKSGPTSAMRPLLTRRSAENQGAPVPSRIRAPRIRRWSDMRSIHRIGPRYGFNRSKNHDIREDADQKHNPRHQKSAGEGMGDPDNKAGDHRRGDTHQI